MTTFGGVPIKVTIPPRIDAKETGIRLSAGLRLAFFAACISTGINNASAATLFMTALSAAATVDMMAICRRSFREALIKWRANTSIAPELFSPSLMTSTRAMITVAGCANPSNSAS